MLTYFTNYYILIESLYGTMSVPKRIWDVTVLTFIGNNQTSKAYKSFQNQGDLIGSNYILPIFGKVVFLNSRCFAVPIYSTAFVFNEPITAQGGFYTNYLLHFQLDYFTGVDELAPCTMHRI